MRSADDIDNINSLEFVTFFKTLIKKNHLKIYSLVKEVNQFEFRVTYFTRSNYLYQGKNNYCDSKSYRAVSILT